MKVIVNMACGLANRMFQYCYYLYLKKLGYDVAVDFYRTVTLAHENVAWNSIFPHAPIHQASAWEVFKTGGGSGIVSKIRRRYFPFICRVKSLSAFEAPLPDRDGHSVYMIGVFQNAKMVETVHDEVAEAFAFSPFVDGHNFTLAEEMQSCQSVAIHVRKGKDYMSRIWYDNTCPVEYYRKAVEMMKEKLDNVVESCVNSVGVNLNTASRHLLSYVSGIGPALAENIVQYRKENGPFSSRNELLKVKRLGDKAFEQCAGFLRIPGAANPLDNSAVHPEAYHIVEKMASSLHVRTEELVSNQELCSRIKAENFVEPDFGLPTVNDILKELVKPGRDPRESASEFSFSDSIHSIDDLSSGMELPGIVTNITAFGAFVDLGIKHNGLIHVTQMGEGRKRVQNPTDVLRLHQHVLVQVLSVDTDRERIGLKLLRKL